MSKKILSIIVTMCLVLAAVPAYSFDVGAADHVHCICGHTDCSGEGHNPSQKWQEWTENDSLPTDDGYYYLTDDVELNKAWNLDNKDIHLCLNRMEVYFNCDGEYAIQTTGNTHLLITDCTGYGQIGSNTDTIFGCFGNSNVDLRNFEVDIENCSSLFTVGEPTDRSAILYAENIEGSSGYNEYKDAITNYGTTTFNNCKFEISTWGNIAVINNQGGTLNTNNSVIKINGKKDQDGKSCGVLNSGGVWYSTNDDIVCDGDESGYGVKSNSTAMTLIEGSHLKGTGEILGYGLEVGGIDTDTDRVYIYGNTNIEGNSASIHLNHLGGLFASSMDNTKKFTGSPASIYDGFSLPKDGDVLVQNADDTMVDKFSVVFPPYSCVELVGTNLVIAKDPSVEPPTVTTQQSSSGVTTTGETATTNKPKVKGVKIKKIKKGKKSVKVYWKKLTSKDATGYQIRYSLKKNMKKAKSKIVKKVTASSVKIKKIKRKKKYYFQIRAYLDFNNKRFYSVWSKKKKIKIK